MMESLLEKWSALIASISDSLQAMSWQTLQQEARSLQNIDWQMLHFLRPEWFYGFIPLILWLLLMARQKQHSQSWKNVCDPQLLPYILTSRQGKRSYLTLILSFVAVSLCLTALAGPVYKKLPQPVFREQSALVILLDLSQSMNATDIKPSRIERAKLELLDILQQRRGGQTALIVYAADAFTVTPLTDDNATIANLVPALETAMMPAQGSNLADALNNADALFKQAGITRGDVLIITDDIHQYENKAIENMADSGHRLSIFGIGTATGAPIPLENGFLQDNTGAIVIPKLDIPKLQRMALSGHGLYVSIAAGNNDTDTLTSLFQSSRLQQSDDESRTETLDLTADTWQEEGVWLVLPLLVLAALWSRKGWLACIVASIVLTLPLPQTGYAAETSDSTIATPGLSFDNLWLTPDQKAMRAFNDGDNEAAAKKFTRPEWKASALYRKGNYEEAARLFEQNNITDETGSTTGSSDNFYNQGNALAKAGKYEDAISAYEKAIELDADNTDAIYNRDLVKEALEKSQQENKKDPSADDSDKNPDDQSDEQSEENQDSSDSKQQQNNDQGDSQEGQQQSQQEQNQGEQNEQPPENKDSSEDTQSQDNPNQNAQQQDNQQQDNQQQDDELKQRNPDDAQSKKDAEEKQQLEQDAANENQDTDKDQQEKSDDETQQNAEQKEQDETEKQQPQTQEVNPREASITEDQQATEQWLRRIQDDPGGLLRRKFLYQYKNIPNQKNSDQPW